jgi:hypothetical protein
MKTNIVTIKIIKTNKELQIIKLSENLFMDMESVSIFVTESGTTLTGKDNFVIEGPMYVPKYYKIVTTISALEFNQARMVFEKNITEEN